MMKNEKDKAVYEYMLQYEKESQYNEVIFKILRDTCVGFGLGMVIIIVLSLFYGIYFDIIIVVAFFIQIGIGVSLGVLLFLRRGDGASITLGGINVLEFVKIIFVFVIAGLVGKPEKNNKFKIKFKIFKLKINRIFLVCIYIGLTCLMFLLLSEFGTLISLLAVGILMLFVTMDKKILRQKNFWICSTIVLVFLAGTILFVINNYQKYADKKIIITDTETEETMEVPYLAQAAKKLKEKGIEGSWVKVYQRFYAYNEILNFEDEYTGNRNQETLSSDSDTNRFTYEYLKNGSGAQYYQMLKARATAGLWGNSSNDESTYIIENSTDMVFAQFMYKAGYVLAMVLILLYYILILSSYLAVTKAKDTYYRALGIAMVFLLICQNIVHIAVNISWMPITGVPLMYVSSGGTMMAVSVIMTFCIILISSGSMNRDPEKDEKDEKDEKNFRLDKKIIFRLLKEIFNNKFNAINCVIALVFFVLGMLFSLNY